MATSKEFQLRKEAVLKALESDLKDKSRKGGVDAPIAELIKRINSHPLFFSTSSCSGRISIFLERSSAMLMSDPYQSGSDGGEQRAKIKQGGEWIYVSHDRAAAEDIVLAVRRVYESEAREGLMVFRFEPFILVLECCSLEAARQMMICAMSSGHRESGVSSAGKRNVVAVRSSIRLEVPIGEDGQLLVSENYLNYLTIAANDKLELNQKRTEKFLSTFTERMSHPIDATSRTLSDVSFHYHNRREVNSVRRKKMLASLEARQLKILSKICDLQIGLGFEIINYGFMSATGLVKSDMCSSRADVTFDLGCQGQKVLFPGCASSSMEDEVSNAKQDFGIWVLKVQKRNAKRTKDTLKHFQLLDQSRRPQVLDDDAHVVFPVTRAFVRYLRRTGVPEERCFLSKIRRISEPTTWEDEALEWLLVNGGELLDLQLDSRNRRQSPHDLLRKSIGMLLQQNGLPDSFLEELPTRWERLQDMVVLPAGSLSGSVWSSFGDELWKTIANALGGLRVARQNRIASTGTRDSQLHVLYGADGVVQHRENGIMYCFDATKCMFSSGNVSEKLRIANLQCQGKTVVDLFAGARKVYACEWNMHAVAALRHNLKINAVEDKCEVIEGDNRVTAPQGIADVVSLGLLPSSECGWPVAVRALRPEGGLLLVHENVKDSDEKAWTDYLLTSISNLATASGRKWEISVSHFERVKWYAPHIRHIVVDLQCSTVPSLA